MGSGGRPVDAPEAAAPLGAPLPTVSVVIPTYRRADRLEQVLRPLLADPDAHEIVVVVDGCRDGSLELVQCLAVEDPRLRGLFIDNRGDMGARAAGAEAATGEVVLFLDDDVLAGPGLVAGHARAHAAGTADVIVGYMPLALGPRRRGDFAERLYAREYEGRCAVYESDPDSPLRELWGGNFSMRRDDALRVGMVNPAFTEHYHADRDFGLRCLEAGLTGAFDRSLAATHLHRRTLDSFIRDARSMGAGRVLNVGMHGAAVGGLGRDEFVVNLPGPLAALVRVTRRPRAYELVSRGLRALIDLAGVARLAPVEELAGRVLRRVEQQRGALDQAQGRRR